MSLWCHDVAMVLRCCYGVMVLLWCHGVALVSRYETFGYLRQDGKPVRIFEHLKTEVSSAHHLDLLHSYLLEASVDEADMNADVHVLLGRSLQVEAAIDEMVSAISRHLPPDWLNSLPYLNASPCRVNRSWL